MHFREALSTTEEEEEKVEVARKKKTMLSEMVKAVELQLKAIKDSGKARMKKDVKEMKVLPLKESVETTTNRIQTIKYVIFNYLFLKHNVYLWLRISYLRGSYKHIACTSLLQEKLFYITEENLYFTHALIQR